MDEKSLGQRLQLARQKSGLTQQQLCQKSGLSYSTLAKIERGAIKSPSIFTIQQIASVLGLGLDELVGASPSISGSEGKQKSKSGVSFVYFDVNGCLVRFFHGAFNKLAEDSGAPADMIETAFWHYNDAVCSGKMNMEDFNAALGEHLGMKKLDWASYYLHAVAPIKEMQELIVWASKSYHVGLLTNIMPGLLDVMKQRGVIPDIAYTAVIDSSEVGCIKPDRQIFEIASQRSGFPPEEILLIDDSRTNIMAAERLGWHVLWFDDFEPTASVARVRTALEL